MTAITASMVKELRDRTGLAMMECKKALTEANGDIELAIDNLRKSGQAKAAKKAGNIAADGAITIIQNGNKAILVEVNCQTDFVAKDDNFKNFSDKVATAALAAGETDAAKIAEDAGLKVVMNRCPKIELFRPFWKPRLDLKI